LTSDPRQAQVFAELKALIAQFKSARRRHDEAAAEAACQAIIKFSTPFPGLTDGAENVVRAVKLLVVLRRAADTISDRLDEAGEADDLLDMLSAFADIHDEWNKFSNDIQAVLTD